MHIKEIQTGTEDILHETRLPGLYMVDAPSKHYKEIEQCTDADKKMLLMFQHVIRDKDGERFAGTDTVEEILELGSLKLGTIDAAVAEVFQRPKKDFIETVTSS